MSFVQLPACGKMPALIQSSSACWNEQTQGTRVAHEQEWILEMRGWLSAPHPYLVVAL